MVLFDIPLYLRWILFFVALALAIAIVVVIIVLVKKKKKPARIKVDEEFINNLIASLGEKENIISVNVDNARLKIEVADLEKANLEAIKSVAESGVFVTGNIIKTLFKYDSLTIKKAIESVL